MADQEKTFNKGDVVGENGNYICVPCGYNRYFRKGEVFTECMSCLSGTKDGDEEFVEGLEMWEKVNEQQSQQRPG